MHRTLRPLRQHPRAAIGVVLGLALVAVLTLTTSTHHQRTVPAVYSPPVRARVYTSFTACLLTGPDGVADGKAAPVWAGMQAASASTHAMASYLALQGAQTTANAEAYIDALSMRGCSLILTSGALPGEGAVARAAALPNSRFITVGAPAGKAANITAVTATIPAVVTRTVANLVAAASETNAATP